MKRRSLLATAGAFAATGCSNALLSPETQAATPRGVGAIMPPETLRMAPPLLAERRF